MITGAGSSKSLHVVGLEARNVLRVRAVRLEFTGAGELVVIGGKNAAGKSSLLSALEMAIAGAGSVPAEALRKGAGKGLARVQLRDADGNGYDVERVLTRDGTNLIVRNLEGDPQRSPQAILDGLRGAISFDPLAFARLAASKRGPDKAEAAEILRRLVGIDVADLDAEDAAAREARTEAGRELRAAEAQLAGMVRHKDAPAEEESVAELRANLELVQGEVARREGLVAASLAAQKAALDAAAKNERAIEAVAAARRALEEAEELAAEASEDVDLAREAALQAIADAEADPIDLAAADVLRARDLLDGVDARNAAVRANRAHDAKALEVKAARKRHDDAEARVQKAEEDRRARMSAAKWPIDGLGFDDAGLVRLHGLPFEQASQAEQVRTSLAIGMALNPKLRVIAIREASTLDADALADLARVAQERDYLVLAERVGSGEEVSVVIEDGEVAEDRREQQEGASE